MAHADLEYLGARLGADSLSWLLATDPIMLRAWMSGVIDAPPSALAMAKELRALAVDAEAQDGPFSFAFASLLGQYVPDFGRTLGAHIRVQAGGSIEVPVSSDAVLVPLYGLAAELTPVYLLRPDSQLRMFANAQTLAGGWGHPLTVQAGEALQQSLDFDPWRPEGMIVMRSSGAGGSFNPDLLPLQILADAASRWVFGPNWPDPAGLLARIPEVVGDLGRVVAGRTAHVQTLIGVAGVVVPYDAVARLPWGTLRRLRDHERERLQDGTPDVVLDCSTPFRAEARPIDGTEWPSDEFWAPMRLTEQYVRDLVFALLLAGKTPPAVAASPAFRLTMDPVQGIPQVSWSVAPTPFVPLELNGDGVDDLERWAAIYSETHHKSLDVAVRRAVSAVRRDDMSDAFIDAVIGWDNAFGSPKGESQLRISASFARLLGASAGERVEIAKYVRDSYDLRSRVVHGDLLALDPHDATQARDDALGLLLRALRTLYTERTDLLPRNSGQRSQALLLDTQQEHSETGIRIDPSF